MQNNLNIECQGLENFSIMQVSNFTRSLFASIEKIDNFLIQSLEGDYTCRHHVDIASTFAKPIVDILLSSSEDLEQNKKDMVYDFLARGRDAVLSTNYQKDDCVDGLLMALTEFALEADEVLHPQTQLFDSKILNRVALTQVIEKLTSIQNVGKNGLSFSLTSGNHQAVIASLVKKKAEDLLGGKSVDKKPQLGNFVVGKIHFTNIEKRCEFLLDGHAVPVFITDKKWIKDFNLGKIRLAKDDRIRARALIERSPVTKKVVYYFIEIEMD